MKITTKKEAPPNFTTGRPLDVGDIADEIQMHAGILQNLLKVALNCNVGLTHEADAIVRAAHRYAGDIRSIGGRLYGAQAKHRDGAAK